MLTISLNSFFHFIFTFKHLNVPYNDVLKSLIDYLTSNSQKSKIIFLNFFDFLAFFSGGGWYQRILFSPKFMDIHGWILQI